MRRFGSIDVHRCGRNRKVGGKEKDTVLVQSCGKKFFLRESIFADWPVFVSCGN